MTPEDYLDRQEALIRQSIGRAAARTGSELEKVVDVPGNIRRRPVLALGIGAAAGFLVGNVLYSNTRYLSRRAFRAVAVPLLRPTISGLGSAIAGILVGSPSPPE